MDDSAKRIAAELGKQGADSVGKKVQEALEDAAKRAGAAAKQVMEDGANFFSKKGEVDESKKGVSEVAAKKGVPEAVSKKL
ncbi:unnamed protein product [Cyprideis torosa]|uniref:Uncharacterized protein n=1 Tax=Cyprideis torosa TaxID=163714 RepID=A0A7R8ZNB3_9CRUS|nr:unnamed protein product [Cyprideis torosa]CAG0895850.1 unnamed protein product [Cyprideis torosa]